MSVGGKTEYMRILEVLCLVTKLPHHVSKVGYGASKPARVRELMFKVA